MSACVGTGSSRKRDSSMREKQSAARGEAKEFSAASLERVLTEELGLSTADPLKIAYSGGIDSHVLIHALAELGTVDPWQVYAIHVDHGLHPWSSEWVRHCQRVCADLGIPFVAEKVEIDRIAQDGLEAAARKARYACLRRHVRAGEVLLTAHHQDDQAETVLLQLLRGAGPRGLAGMPAVSRFSAGRLARPLLRFTRAALARYAEDHRLRWIEDSSNLDQRLARNFVRNRVLPIVAERWPDAARRLSRSARHAAEAAALLDGIAAEDLQVCRIIGKRALRISRLVHLSDARRKNLVRYWIREHGLPAPSEMRLDLVLRQLRLTTQSRSARIRWPGVEVRRYRDELYVVSIGQIREPAPGWNAVWSPDTALEIPGIGKQLRAVAAVGAGLAQARIAGHRLRVRLRRGGESCRLPGRRHHHALKKLLQEAGIPPWERRTLPLVYVDDTLAAIGDRWVCEPFAARRGEAGLVLVLEPIDESI